MLRQVSLRNFKAFEQVTIDLGLITVLIGPNGTGKSSIAQALMLLKQSPNEQRLKLNGNWVSLGHFRQVLHQGRAEESREKALAREVVIALEVELDEPVGDMLPKGAKYLFEAAFDIDGALRRVRAELVDCEQGPIAVEWSSLKGASKAHLRVGASECKLEPFAGIRLGFSLSAASGSPEDLDAANLAVQRLNSQVDLLQRTFLVQPIRGFGQPYYPLSDAPIDDFLAKGASGQPSEVASTLVYRRELEERISRWTGKVAHLKIRANVIPPKQVAVEAAAIEDAGATWINLVNEGFGTNQLVPLLIQLASVPQGSVIAVEEPEIHLHPGAQGLLAQLLTEVALSERKQMLITTHSEHILMAFLTEVAKGVLKPESLSVYHFEKKESTAQATRLSVNEKGQLSGGLRGFFEASLDQLEGYMKALASAG